MENFKLESGMIAVADPSQKDLTSSLVFLAKKGIWNCSVEYEETFNGKAISKLIVSNKDIDESDAALAMSMLLGRESLFETTDGSINVNSSQIGVFDAVYFRLDENVRNCKRISDKVICEEEPWYSICCDRSLSPEKWGVIPNGCVSYVPFDGNYKFTTFVNNSGVVVKIELNLLSPVPLVS